MRHGAQLVITDLKTREELAESVDEIMGWYETYREMFPDRDISRPVFVLGEHRANDFTDVDLVVQNPGVPRESEFVRLAHEHGVLVESDVSLFFRFCPFPIYAVTGTRGKSTTTALVGKMLFHLHPKTVVAGNIAVSPLEFLDDLLLEPAPVPVVLELSSWLIESLENVSCAPDIAVLTNIFEDHLNRYPSFEAYATSKETLFVRQTKDQVAVFNRDHDLVRRMASRTQSRMMWFSLRPFETEDGAFVDAAVIFARCDGQVESILPVAEMNLRGEHNVQNALAATCVARRAGVSVDAIRETLRTFAGLPGRQEVARERDGVVYVNDTTATSPDGAIAALDRFGQTKRIVLICGGSSKNLSLDALGKAIRATCEFVVLLEGDATDAFAAAIGDSVSTIRVGSMQKAVEAASRVAKSGDVVLLSPGTASFGMFKNEYDRGAQFVEAVKALSVAELRTP
jgi:UDP-N-acetylmuramoylalanine--D-glutamate ligase